MFRAKDLMAVVVDTECFSIRFNYSANGDADILHTFIANCMFSLLLAM